MATILEISDSTTTVELNLAEGVSGFKLGGLEDAWQPSNPFYKGGGTWQSSPMSPGRQLVDRQFENTIDTFSVHVEGSTQDNLITEVQDLKRLLEKAADYWASDWQPTPVYIKAKADNETNARYALISTGRIVQDGNPYACRFNGGVGSTNIYWMWDLQLIIEHSMWTENAPGTGTATEASMVQTWDGRNLGNVDDAGVRDPTTAEDVYIGNKQCDKNLSDIYVDDGGVFGANLLDAALPQSLLPAVPAVNDAIYFGSAANRPFSSLVFDIGTAMSDVTLTWEYCTNAVGPVFTAFGAAEIQDEDNDGNSAWTATGSQSVHWTQDTGTTWVSGTVNGVAGFWVRARVSAIGATPTPPQQQNKNIYTLMTGYAEIQAAAVGGDIPAIAKMTIRNRSNISSTSSPGLMAADKVYLGLRSTSRGDDFVAYLNFAPTQNPTGITCDDAGAPVAAFANDPVAATNWVLTYNSASVDTSELAATFEFATTVQRQYAGKYRLFLRGKQTAGTAGEVEFGFDLYTEGSRISVTDNQTFPTTNDNQFIDMGDIEIPSVQLTSTEVYSDFELQLFVSNSTGTSTADFYDIFLLPVDEFAVESFISASTGYLALGDHTDYLKIDSISIPKLRLRTLLYNNSDQIKGNWAYINNGEFFLQSNAKQRLWMIQARRYNNSETDLRSEHETASVITIQKQQRYLSMRGSR